VAIDLLGGATRRPTCNNNTTATAATSADDNGNEQTMKMDGSCVTASHPSMLAKVKDLPELKALTAASCEKMLRYLLSDDTALPTHPLFAHGNTTCVGLLTEIAKDEASQEQRRRNETACSADGTTEDGEIYDENKSQKSMSIPLGLLGGGEDGVNAEEMAAMLEAEMKEQQRLESEATALRESMGVHWVPFLDKALDVTATHSLTTSSAQSAALKRADKEYGCVMYGAYGCVDDAQWSSSTRSIHLHDLYDVFVAMRMSTKLSADLRRQLGIVIKSSDGEDADDEEPSNAAATGEGVEEEDNDEGQDEEDFNQQVSRQITEIIAKAKEHQQRASSSPASSPSAPTAIIRLTQHKAFAEGAEFRAFVLIQKANGGGDSSSSSSFFDITVLGLCQKRVDQVFTFLLEEDHNKGIAGAAEDVIVSLFSKEIEGEEGVDAPTTLAASIFNHLVKKAPTPTSGKNSAETASSVEEQKGDCSNKANADTATTDDPITDLIIGIDITIESASLPIYVLGMSAVAAGSEQWPFLTEAEKTSSNTTTATTPATSVSHLNNPFLGPIIEKMSIPFCRLFRTLADIKGHYMATMMNNSGESRVGSNANAKQRTIYVASEQCDLVGDGKQMFSHTAIPKELADTESFIAALKKSSDAEMLRGLTNGDQHGGGNSNGNGNAAAAEDPTSLSAFMRHLQNQ